MARSQKQSHLLEKLDAGLNRFLVAISGGVLAVMMFLTALDVVFRYVFNDPIAGSLETVEYMMALIVPLSIAYCAFQKSHVAVELIVDRMPKRSRTWLDLFVTAVTLVFVLVIAWQNVLYTREIYDSKLTSSVLLIPTYPFVTAVVIGFGAFTLSLIVHFAELASSLTSEETPK